MLAWVHLFHFAFHSVSITVARKKKSSRGIPFCPPPYVLTEFSCIAASHFATAHLAFRIRPRNTVGKSFFLAFITIKVAKKKINKGNTHTQEGIVEVAFQQNIPSKILGLRLSQERYITENSIALFKRNKLIFNSLTITSSFLREGVIARSIPVFCFLSSRSFILFFFRFGFPIIDSK